MVDRRGRNILLVWFKRLVDENIPYDGFLCPAPRGSPDKSLIELWEFGEAICSRIWPMRIKFAHLTEEQRQIIWRVILFLKTDLEFEWPNFPAYDYTPVLFGIILAMTGLLGCQSISNVVISISFMLCFIGFLFIAAGGLKSQLNYKRQEKKFYQSGHSKVWPFFRTTDYENASKNTKGDLQQMQ